MPRFIVTLLTSLILMAFSSVNLANSTPSSYGPTKANDRLWQIATKTRPSSDITPQQMMVALVQRNPRSFKDHNVNGLFTGIQLRIPDYNSIVANSPLQAEIMVAKHNKLWKAGIPVALNLPKPTQILNHPKPPRTAHATAHSPQSTPMNALPTPNIQWLKVQKHVDVLSANVKNFVFQSHAQLMSFAEGQMVLKKQLVNMARSMKELNDQVDKQNMTITQGHSTYIEDQTAWKELLQNYVIAGAALLALFAAFLIAVWVKLTSLSQRIAVAAVTNPAQPIQPAQKIVAEEDEELEDEYDFINSAEGIPAKLDLARAYMDMDDMEGACQILNEIIKNSDKQYQSQAQQLLSHIQLPNTAHHEPA